MTIRNACLYIVSCLVFSLFAVGLASKAHHHEGNYEFLIAQGGANKASSRPDFSALPPLITVEGIGLLRQFVQFKTARVGKEIKIELGVAKRNKDEVYDAFIGHWLPKSAKLTSGKVTKDTPSGQTVATFTWTPKTAGKQAFAFETENAKGVKNLAAFFYTIE